MGNRTLWQAVIWPKIKALLFVQKQEQRFNPLSIKEGQYVTLHTLDESDLNWRVDSIREYKRSMNGHEYRFTDYLLDGSSNGTTQSRTLRMYPKPAKDAEASGRKNYLMLLSLKEDKGCDMKDESYTGLVEYVRGNCDGTNESEVYDDNNEVLKEKWFRIDDAKGPYEAQVVATEDRNNDGKIDQSEIERSSLEYYDFWREIDVPGGKQRQFLFVEIDRKNGWLQMWKGPEIDETEVF